MPQIDLSSLFEAAMDAVPLIGGAPQIQKLELNGNGDYTLVMTVDDEAWRDGESRVAELKACEGLMVMYYYDEAKWSEPHVIWNDSVTRVVYRFECVIKASDINWHA
jgi:thiamine monophosphate kinase